MLRKISQHAIAARSNPRCARIAALRMVSIIASGSIRTPGKDRREEIYPFLICLEPRRRRAVNFKRVQDLVKSRVTALGKMQLFEKITHATIAISSAHCPILPKILDSNRPVSPRMTQNFNPIRQHTDFNWLTGILYASRSVAFASS